jgi:alkanesulfonate monooxygenase SsuD/methylene tetrahydromethanopterin reductase-like flavin-dependent oxidoreductase (luciferase family)
MQISMTLPTMLPMGRAELLAWCRAVDEGPWGGLAVPERITYTSSSWTAQLAAAAALTERVPLWTTVIVLPAHSAVQTAKDLATVDQICNGRLRAGVGVGGREQDFQAVEASFERRWSRLDEQVALMQRVWSGQPPFEDSAPVGPPPVQAGGPPMYSGAFGPKALARAAHWAVGVVDGSTVTGADLATQQGVVSRVQEAWKNAGRDEPPYVASSLWYALGDGAAERLHDYAYTYLEIFGPQMAGAMADAAFASSPEALQRAVDAAAEAGCDEIFLVPTTTDVTELDRTREALSL